MKKYFLLNCFALLTFHFCMAQAKDYKVVFDITGKDTIDHQTVMRQVTGIAKANPDAKLQVVIYGGSLNMVVKNKSVVEEGIKKLAGNKNVSFKVCAVTMQRYNVDKSQLLPGVEVVDDGIYEIITKQREGWGYIKVGN